MRYIALYEIKLKVDAINPDTKNLNISLLFLLKNLYNLEIISILFYLNTRCYFCIYLTYKSN